MPRSRIEYAREWRKEHPGYYGKSNITAKQWHQSHADEINKQKRARNLALKREVVLHYSSGSGQCKRCGFDDVRALSIDHINGGGEKHKRAIKKVSGSLFYLWLKQNNYPLGYQVFCMNCQLIKAMENREFAQGNKPMVRI